MDKGIEKQDITRPAHPKNAKGKPGAKPCWSSGAKTIVGTAVSAASRIWYTVNNGTLAEIYFPDVDQANTRAVRFIVTGSRKFFSDELNDATHHVEWLEVGAPSCRIESRSNSGRYRLTKEIVPDPTRDTLLLRCRFMPAKQEDFKLYLVIDAHIGDRGERNDAWAGTYKGAPMVFAQRGNLSLACMTSPPSPKTSVGYVGRSDGLTMLCRHKQLPDANHAPDGNVAMTLEIDYKSSKSKDGSFLVAIGAGSDSAEAAQQARAGVLEDFDITRDLFLRQWREKQAGFHDMADLSGHKLDLYRVSTSVLESHQSKRFRGGFVASLSLPWGFARGDKDVGGYHVLWPRDTVETALGMLASGDAHSARSTLFYLQCTQDAGGGWSQNLWLDGTPHWSGVQLDNVALPIILADKLHREDALGGVNPTRMVHDAISFLLRHGPVTQQDRWETTPGYSPYTMATQVVALLAAAGFAEREGLPARAAFLRSTADAWNDAIDELTYVEDTPLARAHSVRGYYLRLAPPRRIEGRAIGHLRIKLPNVPRGPKTRRAIDILSPGALALVRFGLRAPDDPRILSTLKLIDATLRRQTKTGPGWVRSTDDGYGEHADGRPFDKTGIGRCWPLLAGERGHYELAAGRRRAALDLLKTIARQTSQCGMIPEQVWDGPDIPARFLLNGHPSGSGMPLAWAHSEYIKLLRSLHAGEVWDRIPQTEERYIRQRHTAGFQIWTPDQRRAWLTAGKDLRFDLTAPARVRWTAGRARGTAKTTDTGFSLHCATLRTRDLAANAAIKITIEPQNPASNKAKTSKAKKQNEKPKPQKPESFIVRVRG
ncbi:MAG TPA: glycoside hydrolase family 15 protein [Acidobacteriaceae bacterium]|jgi:glucoamylase|nr:glycoside hydrolase family 15 protein [Acidobacteriaceae bacterium]